MTRNSLPREIDATGKSRWLAVVATWAALLALPFVFALLIQVPLCLNRALSGYFENLPQLHALWLLSLLFVLPSYALFVWRMRAMRHRWLQAGLLTLLLAGILPLVWVFGFMTSRALFTACVT